MANPYKEKLLDPRWQKKRLFIFNRDNFTCQLCQDKDSTLHIHHKKYYGEPWDVGNSDLITLCSYCHLLVEKLPEKYFPLKISKVITESNEVDFRCFLKDDKGAFVSFIKLRGNELFLFPSMDYECILKMYNILKDL
jgi:hypothetical protein